MTVIEAVCPWHANDPARPTNSRPCLGVGKPDEGNAFYARQATAHDINLGRILAGELRKLTSLITNGDAERILAKIPPAYRDLLKNQGSDPVEGWIEQRLTDLILNRGYSILPDTATDA